MDHKTHRKISLLFIKYTPAIMALTCSVKILLLSLDEDDVFFTSQPYVNIINVLADAVIVVGVYFLGRTFNYCNKHANLCKVAMLGYICYGLSLAFQLHSKMLIPITVAYVLLVLSMIVSYRETK